MDISGENPQLSPAAVTSLALVLNELATNATKYGALGNPSGRLSIRCDRQDARFTLNWIEHAPGLQGPEHVELGGFGTRLLSTTVRLQFDGSISYKSERDTLRIILDLNPSRF